MPTLPTTVPLTKLWTAVLALLATACLAGMFLLSLDASDRATEGQRAVVRTVTDAAAAALSADIARTPVQRGSSIFRDARVVEALANFEKATLSHPRQIEATQVEFQDSFNLVANETLLGEFPKMSVALLDENSKITTSTGVDTALFETLLKYSDFAAMQKRPEGSSPSAFFLNDQLYAATISHRVGTALGRRILTIQPVDISGSSHFRRVLGTSYAAAFVKKDNIIGESIGEVVDQDFLDLVSAQGDAVPSGSATEAKEVGSIPTRRVGAIARVPGLIAPKTFIAIVARDALRPPKDVARALGDANRKGLAEQLPWPLLGALLFFSLILTFFLPRLESTSPIRRLTSELRLIAQGQGHQIYPDAYRGIFSDLAQATVDAQQALADSWNQEFDGEDEEEEESDNGQERVEGEDQKSSASGSSTDQQGDAKEEASSKAHTFEPPPGPAGGVSPAFSNGSPDRSNTTVPIDTNTVAFQSGTQNGEESEAPPPGNREAYYQDLYRQFIETKKQCGEAVDQLTYERLATKLRKNTDDLMKRDGTKDVLFTVYVKEGKAALKARIVR